MGVTKFSAALRVSLGVSLVVFALATGLMQRSPWILPFLAAGFTCAYLFGQLRLWRVARNSGKLKRYWLQLPADFGVQFLLVSVLYLAGFGLSALLSGGVSLAAFAPGDAIWPIAAGALGAIMGLYIDRLEGRPSGWYPAWMTGKDDDGADEYPARQQIRLLPGKVSPDSFFQIPVPAPADAPKGPDEGETADGAGLRALTDDDITRAEARLGRALPDLLISLYKMQNGGAVAPVCIPVSDPAEATRYEHILLPFGSCGDIAPAGTLRTVRDTIGDHTDPDATDDTYVPDGADAMIVLAQWYRETLFLDYNHPGAPRVGYADFDRFDLDGAPDPITWWPDFETFFDRLRHFEPV